MEGEMLTFLQQYILPYLMAAPGATMLSIDSRSVNVEMLLVEDARQVLASAPFHVNGVRAHSMGLPHPENHPKDNAKDTIRPKLTILPRTCSYLSASDHLLI